MFILRSGLYYGQKFLFVSKWLHKTKIPHLKHSPTVTEEYLNGNIRNFYALGAQCTVFLLFLFTSPAMRQNSGSSFKRQNTFMMQQKESNSSRLHFQLTIPYNISWITKATKKMLMLLLQRKSLGLTRKRCCYFYCKIEIRCVCVCMCVCGAHNACVRACVRAKILLQLSEIKINTLASYTKS